MITDKNTAPESQKESQAPSRRPVLVIGGGLAGCDCAWFLASQGIKVILVESKKIQRTPAQKSDHFAELVCTNSLKGLLAHSAHGILKGEMRRLGSVVLETALETQVPSGDALSVDRENFGAKLTEKLQNHPNIQIIEKIVSNPLEEKDFYGASHVVVATGPLTLDPLTDWLGKNLSTITEGTGADNDTGLYFYDAIAPVIDADSLDMSKLYFGNRHRLEESHEDVLPGYLNAAMTKEQYEIFIEALINAEKTPSKNFEELRYFESCLPIDVMAERGRETPRFSCMTPRGLYEDDWIKEWGGGRKPYAVVQLRRENLLGSAYNMVGFQTRLTYKEQLRVFRMIPGLENAEFLHLGSVHRNTFLHAQKMLNPDMSSKKFPQLFFAGQITGVEGYTESASFGLYVGLQILAQLKGVTSPSFPAETALGALLNYLMTSERPVPSNINFGLFPELKQSKKELVLELRSLPKEEAQNEKSEKRRLDVKTYKRNLMAKRALEASEQLFQNDLSFFQRNDEPGHLNNLNHLNKSQFIPNSLGDSQKELETNS